MSFSLLMDVCGGVVACFGQSASFDFDGACGGTLCSFISAVSRALFFLHVKGLINGRLVDSFCLNFVARRIVGQRSFCTAQKRAGATFS